jgi:hypothetical protein
MWWAMAAFMGRYLYEGIVPALAVSSPELLQGESIDVELLDLKMVAISVSVSLPRASF